MYIYDVQHDGGITVVALCIFMTCSMTAASHQSGCSMYIYDVQHDGGITVVALCIFMM